MEGLIIIIGIVFSIISAINKSKTVKKNAPGKAAAPGKPAAPAASVPRMRTEPIQPAVRPTIAPTVHPTAASQPESFWQQVSKAIGEELGAEKPDRGHEAVGRMSEGDSRECDHGSVGGSMAYSGHQEGGTGKQEKKPARPAYQNPAADPLYRPAMNAQEMRRAVVMAEILKRPQDRMAEQARRWSAR